jgi:hypothetical protein
MHYRSNFFISLGIWISLIPFLGIPRAWRDGLVVATGLFILVIFLGPIILKKLQTKPRRSASRPKNTMDQSGDLKFSDISTKSLNPDAASFTARDNVSDNKQNTA